MNEILIVCLNKKSLIKWVICLCCNVIKSVNVLTKSEENESLLIKLISQFENPELQKGYLDKFKKN